MEAKKRKVYSAEFKAKVGIDAVRGTATIADIAHQHGVHPVMVSQWKQAILARASSLFAAKRGPKAKAASAGLDRQATEIARLQMEIDCLRKKCGL